MAGWLALRTEVLGRLDDPGAEDLEPEAVDGHSGSQRVVGGDQPLGQSQSVDRRVGGSGGRNAGTARPTFSPFWSYSPRLSMNAGLGSPAFSRKTRVVGICSSSFFRFCSASASLDRNGSKVAPILEYACSKK